MSSSLPPIRNVIACSSPPLSSSPGKPDRHPEGCRCVYEAAIRALVATETSRGVFAIACATGKSRLILHTIRDIAADVNVIVFPTLSLIRDFVKESCDVLPLIADNHVMISSDEDYTVDCCTRKETKDALRTIQTLSTVSQISKWLLIHSSTAAEAPTAAAAKPKTQLLISTYASLNKVRTALSTSTKKNSVFVAFDEAHHVTEKNNVPVIFGNSDAEDDLPLAPKMAFFTATPVNRNGVEMTSSTAMATARAAAAATRWSCGPTLIQVSFSTAQEAGALKKFLPVLGITREDDLTTKLAAAKSAPNKRWIVIQNTFERILEAVARTGNGGVMAYTRFATISDAAMTTSAGDDKEDGDDDDDDEYGDEDRLVGRGFAADEIGTAAAQAKAAFKAVAIRIPRLREAFPGGVLLRCIRSSDKPRVVATKVTDFDAAVEKNRRMASGAAGRQIVILVSCKKLSEGINCRFANCAAFLDSRRSYVENTQIIGRALRRTELDDGNSEATVLLLATLNIADYRAASEIKDSAERVSALDALVRRDCVDTSARRAPFESLLVVIAALLEADPELRARILEELKRRERGGGGHVENKTQRGSDVVEIDGLKLATIIGGDDDESLIQWSANAFCEATLTACLRHEIIDDTCRWWMTFEKIKALMGRPSQDSKNADEKRLGIWIQSQVSNTRANGGEGCKAMKRGDARREAWDEFVTSRPDWFMDFEKKWTSIFEKVKVLTDRPSQNSKDADEKRLARWIAQQTRNASANEGDGQFAMKRADARRRAWDEFVSLRPEWFTDLDEKWFLTFEKVKALTGKPSCSSPDADEKRMHRWISSRNARANGGEGIEAMKRGDARRNVWDEFMSSRPEWFVNKWNLIFEKVKSLTDKPSQYSKNTEEKRLGLWIQTQIANARANGGEGYQAMKRGDTRREAWDEFVSSRPDWFTDFDEKWNLMFEKVKALTDKPIKSSSKNAEEKRLNQWIAGQVKNARANDGEGQYAMKRGDARREAWDEFVSSRPVWFVDLDEKWNSMFEKVQALTSRPNHNSKDVVEKRLASWIQNQISNAKVDDGEGQHAMERGDARREAWDLFVSSRPDWFTDLDEKWNLTFEKVKVLTVKPSTCSKNVDEKRLGSWIQSQISNAKVDDGEGQYAMKRGDARREAWDLFVSSRPDWFTDLDEKWNLTFEKVKVLTVKPSKYSKNVDEKRLGSWIQSQFWNARVNGGEGRFAMKRGDARRESWDLFVLSRPEWFSTERICKKRSRDSGESLVPPPPTRQRRGVAMASLESEPVPPDPQTPTETTPTTATQPTTPPTIADASPPLPQQQQPSSLTPEQIASRYGAVHTPAHRAFKIRNSRLFAALFIRASNADEAAAAAGHNRALIYLDDSALGAFNTTGILALENGIARHMLFVPNPSAEACASLSSQAPGVNIMQSMLNEALATQHWKDILFTDAYLDVCSSSPERVKIDADSIINRFAAATAVGAATVFTLGVTLTSRDPIGRPLTCRMPLLVDEIMKTARRAGFSIRRVEDYEARELVAAARTGDEDGGRGGDCGGDDESFHVYLGTSTTIFFVLTTV